MESSYVKRFLIRRFSLPSSKISIVPNGLSSVFLKPAPSINLPLLAKSSNLSRSVKLLVPCRPYPHKNLSILPSVIDLLDKLHHLSLEIFITCTSRELLLGGIRHDNIRCLGSIPSNTLRAWYSSLDGVLFPTLAECFSSAPIETIFCKSRSLLQIYLQ